MTTWRLSADAYTVAVLERCVNHGGDLSGFYYYLRSGDYESATCNASGSNLSTFGLLVRLLVQSLPESAFGSPAKVEAWRGLHAIEGKR